MKRGLMRFGSLEFFRTLDDQGSRGDKLDGTLHYAPPAGLEITMVEDGRRVSGVSFSSAAQNMFVYCTSMELSEELAKEFGNFCVEIVDMGRILDRLRRRAYAGSHLNYAGMLHQATEYRSPEDVPGADWAFPERLVFMKPPSYSHQMEYRLVLPIKEDHTSSNFFIEVCIGDITDMAKFHSFL